MSHPLPLAPFRRQLQLLTNADLAKLFGVTPDWLYRHAKRLQDDHGMPAPLPGFGQIRWDPVALRRWLDGYMAAHDRLQASGTEGAGTPIELGLSVETDIHDLLARGEALAAKEGGAG